MFLSPALLSLATILLSPSTAASPGISSSCTKAVHADPKVTWTTTKCAYCYPSETHSNDTLWVNYNGTLANGGKLFDSSYSADKPWPKGDPFSFVLGAGKVIEGFDAGLYKMCPGERRNLVILPAFAYGQKGTSDGAIPPNATLVFDIELMGVGTTYTPLSMLSKNPVPNW